MKFVINTTATHHAVLEALRALDPNVEVTLNVKKSEEELLCDKIRANMAHYALGYVRASNIEAVKEIGMISISGIDQVRYNGANIEVSTDVIGDELVDEETDKWGGELCGDMLHNLDGLFMIILFGVAPEEQVIEAMVNGDVECTNLDIEFQKTIFADYPKFVNDVLNGVDFAGKVLVDIEEGLDS